MNDFKSRLSQLNQNLNILREREAKYGGNAPLELLNQISDHEQAITLTEQALAGDLSEAEWGEAMRPLLVHIRDHATPPQRDKNLGILLNNVRKIWVEDYLNSALLNAITIDLGLQEKRAAIPQPFEHLNIRWREAEQAEQDLPTGTRAYDVYQQAQSSLLILGQPGAGKTTLLATLSRDLLAEAETNPLAPVPVIFNLSSWAAGQKPLAKWLEDELNQQYQVSRKLAQTWLAEERLALLLDGLDEVAETRREACISAINTYRESHMGPLVVCSRLKDYEALQAQLNLGQAIGLKMLTRAQVEHYFQRLEAQRPDPAAAEGELLALFERIWQDEALQALTQTPLMLNIITLTYAYSQAPALPQGEGDSLRTQIFDAYSERMFNRVGRTKFSLLHPQEKTLRYLGYVAAQLQAHSLTQFSIGQIRDSWLPAGKTRRQYRWLSGLLFGLSGGLFVGLFVGLLFGLGGRLLVGLLIGLSGGLIVGLRDEDPAESLRWAWKPALKALGLTILGGLLGRGGIGLLAEAGVILPAWLVWGLLFGLSGGLIVGLLVGLLGRLLGGLLGGLIFGLIGGLFGGLFDGLGGELMIGLLVGLIFGLGGGLMIESVSHKVEPDQEVRRSRRSALIGGLLVGLLGGLMGGLIDGLLGGLLVGLLVGLSGGLQAGGSFLIQHYLRLFVLNRHNLLPFELIPFLNQATDLIFLQRLGGSYRFIHRSVQEHFAARWLAPPPEEA